jgi:DNA repair photolyase
MATADACVERCDRSVSTVERKLQITRGCLDVLRAVSQSCGDHSQRTISSRAISIFCASSRRAMPRRQRFSDVSRSNVAASARTAHDLAARSADAIEQLRAAKIPVGVMVAPVIPGLTDHEVPKILEACAKAGAQFAGYTIIRLPWAVAPLFEHWLEEHFPDRKEKVLRRIRHLRGNRLNNSQWHTRMTGEGIFASRSRRYSRSVVVGPESARGRRFRANHFADRRLSCAFLHKRAAAKHGSSAMFRWNLR